MRHKHRYGKTPSLLRLLAPKHHKSANLIRDVALGALIAKEIIKKWFLYFFI